MIKIYNGDCLEIMSKIQDKSMDAIITDPPYGTTACKWDSVIPFEPMWDQLKRIIKPNGAIVLFGSEPFSSALRMSNIKMYKYDWVWQKDNSSNFFAAKFQPLNDTENVVVFSFGGCNNGTKNPVIYNLQGVKQINIMHVNSKGIGGKVGRVKGTASLEGRQYKQTQTGYPFKTLFFKRDSKAKHPTQKPVALMEYLIKTYTNECETVLDFTMGSGTTLVACKRTNRNGIGIEQDKKYCEIAIERLKNETSHLTA